MEIKVNEVREIQFVVVVKNDREFEELEKLLTEKSKSCHIGIVPLSPNYSKKIVKYEQNIFTHYVTVRRIGVDKKQLVGVLNRIVSKTNEDLNFKLISIKFI